MPSLAWLSLGALIVAMVLSCTTELNIGVLAVALAWIVGVYFGGMRLEEVVSGFPVQLFLTLVGVTLLFSQARVNGTLDRVAAVAIQCARGRAGIVPIVFFFLALIFASIGPGNIAATALLAPLAMATAGRAGVPAFLMAIMVCSGANAGALSPFAPTGIIANGLMANIGLEGVQWWTYFNVLVAQSFVGFAGFFLFGGTRLLLSGTAVTVVPFAP